MNQTLEAVYRLDNWVNENGWAGWDPYDILGHALVLKAEKPFKGRAKNIVRKLIRETTELFPVTTRKVLGVKPRINAKAMGLFASAYINLYKIFKDSSYLKKAQICLNWLAQNHTKNYNGICWGYPFDWQSLHFLPCGTPSGVVSSTVGNAFFEFYKVIGEEKYLNICKQICNFFIKDLNIDTTSEDKICFGYTPLSYTHVHNANLFVSDFLIKVGANIQNRIYMEHGVKALRYTLDKQNKDGSFYYRGPEDQTRYNLSNETMTKIDHYHTGFVLRSLLSISEHTNIRSASNALDTGYKYYINNLFEDETIPKMDPQNLYPIDIHSCAEAILCLSTLSKRYSDSANIVKKVTRWTIQNMQDKHGFFYYRFYSKRRIAKIPYIRWAQSWMLLALSAYLYEYHDTIK